MSLAGCIGIVYMCFYYLSCQPVQDVLNDMAINFIFLRFFSYHTAVVDPGEGPRTPVVLG